MRKTQRNISIRNRSLHSSIRINLIGVISLMVILTGILLYFTNERQNEQVLSSYCGDFGFYGKTLTLMKSGTFIFSYYGCTQSNGYVKGNWSVGDKNILTFYPNQPDNVLGSKYQLIGNQLLSANRNIKNFIICDEFFTRWYE